ncbi:MAG TPA: hypothetical protein VIC57_07645 [Candidatus Dormibacteraeota bacterium]
MVEHLPLVAHHAPALVDDPLQVITDPAGWVASWLWAAIFGKDQVAQPTWAADLFARAFFFTGLDASDCSGGGGRCSSFSIWSALQTTGYLVLAMALLFRMIRNMVDEDKRPVAQWLLFDVIVRGAFGIAAINISYAVLAMLMHSSIVIGGAVFDTIMSVTTGSAGGEAGLRQALTGVLSPVNLPPIPLILETLVLLYLIALLVASRVAIIFAIAVAPLVLPISAFSSENSLVIWWLRLIAQGLLVPVVMGALFAVALVLIQGVGGVAGGALEPVLGTLTAVVALWFVGHSIGHLLKHMFPNHKSLMANAATAQGQFAYVRSQIGAAISPVTSIIRR